MKEIVWKYCLLAFYLLFSFHSLKAQSPPRYVADPAVHDFSGTQSFLSSDLMEGREAGTRGGLLASCYISSMMQFCGLEPFGKSADRSDYFQDFYILRFKSGVSSVALLNNNLSADSVVPLLEGIDYELRPGYNSTVAEAPLVFAGYGISAPAKGYDDYNGLAVKDRIVVVMDGFPGHADTTSPAWKKLGGQQGGEYGALEQKLQTASRLGAIALVLLVKKSPEPGESVYDDADYVLSGDTMVIKISCFKLGPDATIKILAGTGIDISDMETRIASDPVPVSVSLKDRSLRCSVVVKKDSIAVRNVVGVIHGKDSTRSLIVGAHYDHLGMRHGKIFNGADDNASGTAGMLALAKVWGACRKQPACNLVFAAWTAEEKGLLGSSYFAEHSGVTAGNTLLYINMDMISRSAPEDTCQKILSIGTLPAGDGLRQIAGLVNQRLTRPFELDLWDVTGHTGSDYASFTAHKVPVMTFFSGFQAEYHTPADTFARVDARKMENVLKLVNGCIFYFIENYRVR